MLSYRTDEERKAKLADLPGKFLKGRQVSLNTRLGNEPRLNC